ncbi:Flp pilus assembly protein TadB [Arthrobacter crystallopoietes BAB-32]|uniref:Flp pilus assembly protein TadB n=1 Tax=Arthrobacter crystallopoietes BAB-32 TaxID=1246476 RepID=N1V432_9MICC|nr:type II secretion system F family protein [Arthrobacter crystallopoietes]EMY34764.1 Flp pilus assembly protein TadB [Arthrobacter crystallopoietes BAB-32]
MTAAAGLAGGIGLFLIWWSCWEVPGHGQRPARSARPSRLQATINQAGIQKVTVQGLLASCLGTGVFTLLLVLVLTQSPPIAACFALFGAWLPYLLIRWRARRRVSAMREIWPDAVDHLRSAIRAGLSLPEALVQLGTRGPVELRPAFVEFGADYRAGGRFDHSLERLKNRLADPVADRIFEALKMTREVGGTDLGKLLGTLADFLRDSARTRSELEARQSWTVNAARLAVAAPWIILMLLATRPEAVAAYNTVGGIMVLLGGLVVSIVCYRLMLRLGALPEDERVLQ